MLIQSFLELNPRLFAIFYHRALGKTSSKKADDRALSFILGTEIFTAIVFLIVYLVISYIINNVGILSPIFLWVMSGIFVLEAFAALFFYYRPKKSRLKSRSSRARKSLTGLFLPADLKNSLIYHAEHSNNRSATIVLGIVTTSLELCFTLPLYIIMSICIYYTFMNLSSIYIIIYIIVATIPLFLIRTCFRTDRTLADVIRIFIKKSPWTKLILPFSYFMLAIVTLIIGFAL